MGDIMKKIVLTLLLLCSTVHAQVTPYSGYIPRNNIDDGTTSGQTTYWNGTKWTPDSTITIDPSNSRASINNTTPSTAFDITTGTENVRIFGDGTDSLTQGLLHLRATSGNPTFMSFTEDSVNDLGAIGFDAGSGSMEFITGGTVTGGTTALTLDETQDATFAGSANITNDITADGITDTSTEATNIAVGTTGTRPTGTAGDIRYNSTLDQLESFGSTWKSLFYSDDYLLSDGTAAGQLAYWDGGSWEPITSGLIWDSVGDELQLDNATWLSGADFAGTGTVNALKVNTDDQIEVGADVAGLYAIVADSGKNVPIWMGDTAGATSFLLKDSSGATIFEFDSDGAVTLASKTLLGTPVPGTLEFSNDRLYLTNVETQRPVDRSSGVITSTTTVSNTVSETTLFTGVIGADDLKSGNVMKIIAYGIYTTDDASNTVTVRVKIGATTLTNVTTAGAVKSRAPWELSGMFTVRSVGVTGTISSHTDLEVGDDLVLDSPETVTIDTTTANDLTITAQWDTADAGDMISIYQGLVEFKN